MGYCPFGLGLCMFALDGTVNSCQKGFTSASFCQTHNEYEILNKKKADANDNRG